MAKTTFVLDPVKLILGALVSGFGIILVHSGMSLRYGYIWVKEEGRL